MVLTFFDKNQSLKVHIHKTKSTCVELNVKYYAHQQMNTISRRFTMLEPLKMSGDMLKDYINDATSYFLEEFYDVLHVSGFGQRKSALCRTLGP